MDTAWLGRFRMLDKDTVGIEDSSGLGCSRMMGYRQVLAFDTRHIRQKGWRGKARTPSEGSVSDMCWFESAV